MRLIDVNNINSKEKIYLCEPQPMYRYDNYEEFIANNDINSITLVSDFPGLLVACRDLHINLQPYADYTAAQCGGNKFSLINDKNIWLKTVDKFIPDSANLSGEITYAHDENNDPIPTDGCYIKIIALLNTGSRMALFTSTGVNTVGMSRWEVTGAVRSQFVQERNNKPVGSGEAYQQHLSRMLSRKKPDVSMYKFLFALLHPDSSAYMNPRKATRASYANKIRVDDTNKLFDSPAFRQAMQQVLKMMLPELSTAVRNKFPVETLANLLNDAVGKAKTEGSANLMTIIEKIANMAYSQDVAIDNQTPILPSASSLDNSLIGKPTEIPALQKGIEIKEVDMLQETLSNLTSPQLTKEEIESLREETGAIESFTMEEKLESEDEQN
jgi:hypothetical protein